MIKNEPLVAENASIGNSPKQLFEIHEANKNIAIYQRDTSGLKQELENLTGQKIEFRKSGTPGQIVDALKEYLTAFPFETSAIRADIEFLLNVFQKVSESETFKVFFATINNNMCRRFHTDVNDLRLLCTYIGEGTLWLPEENLNRNALDSMKDNENIVKDESMIGKVSSGDVAILKGCIYPAEGTRAVVHRSPTIEESGRERLLLRIDTEEFMTSL